MNQRTASRNKSPFGYLVLGLAAIALIIGVLVWMNRPSGKAPESVAAVGKSPELTAEQAEKLLRTAQLANGHLENLDLAAADALYSEIAERLPNEPLAVRNQAICRYLLLEQQKADEAAVRSALARLQEIEPDEPATHWLLGKVAMKSPATDAADAISHFQRAAELSPESAIYWYEAYDAARVMPDGDALAKEFLGRAYRLAPNNLFLLGDWLLAQAQAKDPAIGETLAAAKQAFAPLRDVVLKRHRADVFQLLDDAVARFEQGDWDGVIRNARICLNVTRPNDFTQGDKRALAPHPLEFAVHEFSERFRERFPRPESSHPLVDMSFAKMPPTGVAGDIRDAVLVDFDLDTSLELLVLQTEKLSVYRQSAPSQWQEVVSVELPGKYHGLLAADLDRDRDHRVNQPADGPTAAESTSCFDADSDVVVYGESGLLLLRNVQDEDGARTFQAVEQPESFGRIEGVITAILVDFDHDSNLDMVCSTRGGLAALLGQGEMMFADVSRFSSFPNLAGSPSISSLVAVDWDRDVDIDIVAVATDHSLGYLENLRHGNFRWQPFSVEYAPLRAASSLAVVESDGNVSWDLLGAGSSGVTLLQTRTPYPGKVELKSIAKLAAAGAEGLLAADIDNNGYQDAVVWTRDSVSVLRAKSDAGFAEPLAVLEGLPADIRRCEVGDVDNDGDLDLCVVGAGEVVLLVNEGGNQNNWLAVRAMGQVDNAGKANHHGIGSLIEVKAGPFYQAQVVAKPVTHFGLGKEPNAAIVRFLWTNGVPQDELEPSANQAICELMTLKGSCPYVYTWTGERFEFFTDCLWAAPIGLQLAEDVLAPSRSWEYLRIPGDRLRAKDGYYSLQVTEELWEAGYFDLVRLIAVDHPADVEIYSNEKVGPAAISEFKLHTVRQRRYPIAARDQRGRDVMASIRRRDEQFLRAFDTTIAPGLAEDHFLELDLGELQSPRHLTLFLTGWIYPTDTSLNVALSRHPGASGPHPPRVLVPDAEGNWREVRAYMGFPGGKTKTISVDLSDAFLTDDYRLRIATSAEIYWDEVFFTVDEEPADVQMTPLVLESADLHYRGFSQARPHRPNAPEAYDYERVQAFPKWPPMRGAFTRYGDVRELVDSADDRMAILGSGDEMTLRFQVPETALPAGWVRDFIMHNVGWDKDADLNTIYGQSVEPLPYRKMSSYPDGPEDQFPSTPAHQDYLRRFQTRFQHAPRFWRRIKEYPIVSP